MLYEQGVKFDGYKYVDKLRYFLYKFIKYTSINFSFSRINISKINNNNPKKILFVVRDWGENTTLNVESIRSLTEYCGENVVEKLVVRRYDSILISIKNIVEKDNYTHIFLDDRIFLTQRGYFAVIKSLYDAYKVGKYLQYNKIVCICGVTDWIVPGKRLTAELVTSDHGIAWGNLGFHKAPRFRHKRKIGPLYAPLSAKTFNELIDLNKGDTAVEYDVAILGQNHYPRNELIETMIPFLEKNKINYYMNSLKNLDYVEYLNIYKKTKIGFNTNWVSGFKDKYHMSGKNFEIMSAGCLLLTQRCFELDLYMQEGVDYVGFDGEKDLLDKIDYYLKNEKERLKIAQSGHDRIMHLHLSYFLWREVDKALYTFHYPKLPSNSKDTETVEVL
tara:strand:+ start:409 stop:1575 length:1167 start_codon:yes stop_codon:yes gene_type:complete